VPDPNNGYGLNITYANSSFGQAINVTPVQMAAAYSSTVNGGTYYKPHILAEDKPDVVKSDVISKETSEAMRGLHEKNVQLNYTFLKRAGYRIGGKTGTAQITKPGGGYYDDRYNGTFIGYIGGDTPEYVIMVEVNQPKVNTYAGIAAAAPLFEKTMNMLINNYTISKVSQ
jgi:cell division protein FtsI/penicillin-binding protein 2